ncbi:hypothetical protein [Mesobacterium pallidum]|uniref:hypothetical protein n=1 Tax=Mesobacterium pallidum TaxID=2872037 RepID=UPI001EE23911|nr:hypothetical protein [Mesobacterium pallidum]
MSDPAADTSSRSPRFGEDHTNWMRALGYALLASLLVVLFLGVSHGGGTVSRPAATFAGLVLAGAAAMVGGFLGFIFGIPRARQTPDADGDYNENTNLEQMSDWLTKIVVGLTLVEFGPLRDQLIVAGGALGPVLIKGDAEIQTAVGVALILYFLILGFLFSYLWTRVYMATVLRRQNALSTREIKDIVAEERKREASADSDAIELVARYLEPETNPDDPMFRGLKGKVQAASVLARSIIFDRARNVRRENWLKPERTALVDRTIPVFQGLIAADPDGSYRNYGQLGYAMVKSSNPDWAEVQRMFETAIEKRPESSEFGAGAYEYNLALALVMQDPAFKAGTPSDAETRARIADLLDVGVEVLKLEAEKPLEDWARLNKYGPFADSQ